MPIGAIATESLPSFVKVFAQFPIHHHLVFRTNLKQHESYDEEVKTRFFHLDVLTTSFTSLYFVPVVTLP
jgi:hypothetical protein